MKRGKEYDVNLFNREIQSGMIHAHTGRSLLGNSVLKGNGMVSNSSEKKRNGIFLKPNPLSALENTELFYSS